MILDITLCNLVFVSMCNYLLVILMGFVIHIKGENFVLKKNRYICLPLFVTSLKYFSCETKVKDKQQNSFFIFLRYEVDILYLSSTRFFFL